MSESSPLSKQIQELYKEHQRKSLIFSFHLRLVTAGVFAIAIPSLLVLTKATIYQVIPAMVIVGFYIVVVHFARYAVEHQLEKDWHGYLQIALDIILLTFYIGFGSPFGPHLIYVGSLKDVYFIIIAVAACQGDYRYTLFATVGSVLMFAIVSISFYATADINTLYQLTPAKNILGYDDIIKYLIYLGIAGYVIGHKVHLVNNVESRLRDASIKMIISGTYGDLNKPNGQIDIGNYSIFSDTKPAEGSFVGADFVSYKETDEGISVMIGDVISHGINVSQGATVALGVYHGLETGNPSKILKAINRSLCEVDLYHGGEAFVMSFLLRPDGKVVYNGELDRITVVRNTGSLEFPNTVGPILGKDKDIIIPSNRYFKLLPGEGFTVVTDGITNQDPHDDRTMLIVSYIPRQKRQRLHES